MSRLSRFLHEMDKVPTDPRKNTGCCDVPVYTLIPCLWDSAFFSWCARSSNCNKCVLWQEHTSEHILNQLRDIQF